MTSQGIALSEEGSRPRTMLLRSNDILVVGPTVRVLLPGEKWISIVRESFPEAKIMAQRMWGEIQNGLEVSCSHEAVTQFADRFQ